MAQMARTSRQSRGAAESTNRRGAYLTENAVATKKHLKIGVGSKDTSRMFAMRHISHPSLSRRRDRAHLRLGVVFGTVGAGTLETRNARTAAACWQSGWICPRPSGLVPDPFGRECIIPAARALETYSAADSAHAARRLRERSTRLSALRSPVGQALFWVRNSCGPPAALCVSGTRFVLLRDTHAAYCGSALD